MRLLVFFTFIVLIVHCLDALPVGQDKNTLEEDSEIKDDLEDYMEYHRYLKEVVQALESDPEFRERLEKANEDDVRSGKIAEELGFVNHNIRTKLDEIKRRELQRLRHLANRQYEITNNLNTDIANVLTNDHLDHGNPHTFEIDDLKKLIKKTTADLEAADQKRKEDFKEYEMQKEFEKHQKLEGLDEIQKKEYMHSLKKEEDARKHHQPLHHPVTRQQLLDIWKNADNMDTNDFDPKVFFMMHDVDGNGVWDADEVKALFIKELDKLYTPGGPNKDLHERAEEMERMREHVFKENDRNHDGLIDFNEFMQETQRADFNQDNGWKPIDENQIYTQAEYQEFERRRLEELRYLQQRGLVDAHGRPLPGAQHQIHQAIQQQQQQQQHQQHSQGSPYHPGQVPQGVPQGYQQGQIHPPGYEQQFQGQVPPQQYHGQVPPQQFQGQVPPPQFQGQQSQQQFQGQQSQQQFQGQQSQQQQFQGQAQQLYNGQAAQPQYQHEVQQNVNVKLGQAPPPQTNQGNTQQNHQSQQTQFQQQNVQGPPQPGQANAPPVQGQAQPAQVHPQLANGQAQQNQYAPPAHNPNLPPA